MNISNSFLVGGAVRDQLLGIPVKEIDWVVVGKTHQQMCDLGFKKVGKDFPVYLHPESKEEYALARKERKTGAGYYGFSCEFGPEVTLEEDLLRRDLTINAIAQDPNTKQIIDPYQGQADLKQRWLRHISDAFSEDPVRILRISRLQAKLAAFNFKIHPETLQMIHQMVAAGALQELVPERVWLEFSKALNQSNMHIFIQSLRETNALKVLFPALDKLWGVPQSEKHHPEVDTGAHMLLTLQMAEQLTDDPVVRFAVLCHDLGKGTTEAHILPKHIGHEHRGVPLVKAWCQKYKVPNNYRQLAELVCNFHLKSHRCLEMTAEKIVDWFQEMDLFRRPTRLPPFLLACEADARGRLGFQANPYPQAKWLQQAFQAVQATDLGPITGDITLHGMKLKNAIRKARIHALFEFQQQSSLKK